MAVFLFEKTLKLSYTHIETDMKKTNFLKPTNSTGYSFRITLLTSLLLVFVTIALWHIYPLAVIVPVLLGVLTICILHQDWCFYAVAFSGLFHGWLVDFSRYEQLKDVWILGSINAPLVDFISILLLVSITLSTIFGAYNKQIRKILPKIFIGLAIYVLFLCFGMYSSLGAYEGLTFASMKYLLRPILFVFLAYWIAPILIVRTRKILRRTLYIWFFTGVAIAIFGLLSLILVDHIGWMRVVPFGIKGFSPLGYNHNQIAEVLVAIIPIGVMLALRSHTKLHKQIFAYGSVLMIISTLLTFSRAAWIALVIQTILFILIYRSHAKKLIGQLPRMVLSIGLFVIPLALLLFIFFSTSIVKSSTSARVGATKAAFFYSTLRPVEGFGPGTFLTVLGDSYIYRLDYGDPLDGHGFIQKIILEEGYVGLILFVSFLIWNILLLYKYRRDRYVSIMLLTVVGAVVFQLLTLHILTV